MRSARFNIVVTVYEMVIVLVTALFFLVAGRPGYTFTTAGLIVLWVSVIVILIQYVNITNRNLLLFLQSFRFNDSTIEFNRIKKFPFRPIYDEFNRIIDEFKILKHEKETEHQYYEYIVRHVNTALLAWDDNGRMVLLNDMAKKALKTPHVSTLQGLSSISPELPGLLKKLKPGEKNIIRIEIGYERIPLSVSLSRFKLDGSFLNLVSFLDIRSELEENESEAWQKLMRLLNHEIVNSISPIKLVSSALIKNLNSGGPGNLIPVEIRKEMHEGLSAIYNRSQGLLRFIDDYKRLTEIPKPDIKKELAAEVIGSVVHLVKNTLVTPDIKISYSVIPAELVLWADRKLVEQAMINLVKNSVYALKNIPEPSIAILAYSEEEKMILEIRDNGTGIPYNIRDFIFMPFFTTKEDGSGIGLSWTRQIMKLHRGTVKVISKEGLGTRVFLCF